MILQEIPAYAVRSYFKILGMISPQERHPDLTRIIEKQKTTLKLPGLALLTPETLKYLGSQSPAQLWKYVTLVETNLITSCPDSERQHDDSGENP